ncbi:indole-3-glycerol phosphate synthase TrpC [Paenibacillus sp. GCM10023252]|uniref:indole-3-glycerol phosphate synthase TrpC n=1 Tax=Paenibacillus sp. GCM10023252 TaxID=3252649 RepID=UPI00361D8927
MFLDKIVATKREEVASLATSFNLSRIERDISNLPPCLGFERALGEGQRKRRSMGLIAEVKKASPSKGLIRTDFHPAELGAAYEGAGADCLSVLTDRDYFQGSNAYLMAVRERVNLPLLRKDFTIDYRQVYEARTIGADAILLIAAILKRTELSELFDIAKSIGLDVLVEVHDRRELETVLELDKAKLIGINNRDLKSFVTNLATTEELIGYIPEGVTVISESGIASTEDVAYLREAGAHGLLIGEHFMRHADVAESVEALLGSVDGR